MPASILRRITRWVFDHLLWDTSSSEREGFGRGLWATRKLIVALAGAAWLTWREWVEHRPPEIAIVAVLHFLFVFAVIGLLVYMGQWVRRNLTKAPGDPANRPHGQ